MFLLLSQLRSAGQLRNRTGIECSIPLQVMVLIPLCYNGRMAAEHTPSLPGFSWNEDSTLRVANSDRKLRRWGSVQQASAMLDDCDRVIIYDLIECGSIRGYKRKPHRANSHWRIDLLSVWEHKQRQMVAQ